MDNWQACSPPPRTAMVGHYCRVEPLDAHRHTKDLYEAYTENQDASIWTYLPYGPFPSLDAYQTWVQSNCDQNDPLFHAIIDLKTEKAVGVASYLRINPTQGVIEVGHINYSPKLQKTPLATETMYLMMKRVFEELEYRRYEWKCDALNAGSRKAAVRLGFVFEGIFRRALMYKQRNRDTAWYSIIDSEWDALKTAFVQWLAPDNFDSHGHQKQRLSDLTQQARNSQPIATY